MESEQKANILLVDDNPANLVALEAVLEDLGENLVMVSSGEEALKHVLVQEFAVILLDVQMPGMDGFETASLIRDREKTRGIPIVFITAVGKSETHVSKGYSLGAVDYIFKPIVPEIVRAKVAAFVGLFKANRERLQQQERELRSKQRFLTSFPASITGEIHGIQPLRQSAPDIFKEMVRQYVELLDLALEQQSYKVEHNISERLGAVAEELGSYRAGPRDVVDIHLRAVEDKSHGCTAEQAKVYASEGRLLTLELMGRLVDYYRRALDQPDAVEAKEEALI
jgi:response regulator RpfG family c-di-GMP phosphodiesterase